MATESKASTFFGGYFFAVSMFINSSCRARTCDTMINSHVLYQLS